MNEYNEHDKKLRVLKQKYCALFNTPVGQEVLNDIKASGFYKKSLFNTDSHIMAYNAGMRDLAMHIEFMATPQPEKPKVQEQSIV